MLLIAFGHKAKQGKGEVANYLKNLYSDIFNIEIHSFGTAIRKELHDEATLLWVEKYGPHMPINGHEALRLVCVKYEIEFDENPPIDNLNPWGKQRRLQQIYARLRRDEDEHYWVKMAMPFIDSSKADIVFIDDMRKEDEFTEVKARNGNTVKVSRLGWVSDVPPHESETALDDAPFDVLIGARNGNLGLLLTLANSAFLAIAKDVAPEYRFRADFLHDVNSKHSRSLVR
jgi:hypothetical protein